MAIAGDIKSIFDHISKNNLFSSELIHDLQDIDYCSSNFASGKYPILLKNDKSKTHQEQRKYGTHQARYYDPENFLINFQFYTVSISIITKFPKYIFEIC